MKPISIGQALLILLNTQSKKNPIIKKIYLTGPEDSKESLELERLLKDPILSEYKISKEPKVINEDPSRRYFETHLAYYILQQQLQHLNSDILNEMLDFYYLYINDNEKIVFDNLFKGGFSTIAGITGDEFSDAVSSIYSADYYKGFSELDRFKLASLIKITYLSNVIKEQGKKNIPLLDVYYNPDSFLNPENRGRFEKEDQKQASTCHFGLLKSYMSTSQDDICFRGRSFPYGKPSERNSFYPDKKWPKENFNKLVHPFSSSISGTLFGVVSILAYLKDLEVSFFNTNRQMAVFLNCLTSVLLYNSGGHTFNEFFSALKIKEVQDAFQDISGFDQISLQTLMTGDNQKPFEKALNETITYNNQWILRHKLQDEIIKGVTLKKTNIIMDKRNENFNLFKNTKSILENNSSVPEKNNNERLSGKAKL